MRLAQLNEKNNFALAADLSDITSEYRCIAPPLLAPPSLKYVSELEEPFSMASVTYAAADQEWTECGVGQDATGDVIGKLASFHTAVHLAEFIRTKCIHFFSKKLWQWPQVVQIPRSRVVILITEEFIRPIGAKASGTAEEKRRDTNL